MNTGILILIIVLALGALGGIGYGIWYAVSSGSGGPSTSGSSFAVPPFGISGPMSSPQQQQPPASFAKTSR